MRDAGGGGDERHHGPHVTVNCAGGGGVPAWPALRRVEPSSRGRTRRSAFDRSPVPVAAPPFRHLRHRRSARHSVPQRRDNRGAEGSMRARRWAAFAAMVVSMVVVAAPAGAAVDPPAACKIERPAGLWPPYFYEDYWNTYTHGGFNSDWVAHPRPVGTVKAVMLFVDFPDRPASAVTQDVADRLPPAAGVLRVPQGVRARGSGPRPTGASTSRSRRSSSGTGCRRTARSGGWTTAPPTPAAAERGRPGRVHGGRGGGRRPRGRLQPLRPDLHRPGAQPDRDRVLAGAQQLHAPDRRRRQRPRQRRQLRRATCSAGATSCSTTRPGTPSASPRATTPAPAARSATWASGT